MSAFSHSRIPIPIPLLDSALFSLHCELEVVFKVVKSFKTANVSSVEDMVFMNASPYGERQIGAFGSVQLSVASSVRRCISDFAVSTKSAYTSGGPHDWIMEADGRSDSLKGMASTEILLTAERSLSDAEDWLLLRSNGNISLSASVSTCISD